MRVTKQQDIKDCGLHVVQYFVKKYHKTIDINDLKSRVNYGRNGINLKELSKLADIFGVSLKSYEVFFKDLVDSGIKEEFIAIINKNGAFHYVVVKIGKKFHINDSIDGEYTLTYEEFEKQYTGIIATQERTTFKYSEKSIKQNSLSLDLPILIIGLFSSLVTIILSLSSTVFMKIIFDKVMPYHLENTLFALTISFVGVCLLRVLTNLLKKISIRYLYLHVELQLKNEILNSLINISSKEIMKFQKEDILRRVSFIGSIASFQSSFWFALFSEIVSIVISSVLLMWVSPQLFGIAIAFAVFLLLNSLVYSFYFKTNNDKSLEVQLSSASEVNYLVNNLHINRTGEWFYAGVNGFNKEFSKQKLLEKHAFNFSAFSKIISELLNLIFPIIITYFSTKLIFNDKITIGQLMLISTASSYLISSLLEFSDFIDAWPRFVKNKQMLNQFLTAKNEELNKNGLKLNKIESFSLENFSYSYDKKIFDISKENFKDLIIQGENGSGKSTFLKAISCLNIGEGNFKINNINFDYYSIEDLRNKIMYIPSYEVFRNTNVLEVITAGHAELIKNFQDNLEKHKLHEIFEAARLSLTMELFNGGQNLSSGQKQVLSLLKIFAKQPLVVVLDEAFENIDQNIFQKFKNILNSMEIIVIEVSHSKRYIRESEVVTFE